MKNHQTVILTGAVALTSLLAVGASATAGAASTTRPGTSTTVRGIAGPHTVKTSTVHTAISTVSGKTETILVNAKGLPLYYYLADTPKKSLVNGELARLWPPLLSANPSANGVRGKLTALKVAAGRQVTYNGHFLYTFVEDSPGNVTGQGVSDFSVVTPQLKAITSAVKGAPTAPSTYGGGVW
ncbi:MAG: hypothetical protein JWM55_1787 [Acidimicrobiaceae bacterium]|nr:hypothetical protein [Acidimicrobiaceae bacterium]